MQVLFLFFVIREKVMAGQRIKDYLKSHNVPFTSIYHPISFSAPRTAHAAHISGKDIAKPVIVKMDGKLMMVVTSANERLNLKFLKKMFHASEVELANEEEFKYIFKDCETGAMPPFGNLYGIEEYISEKLTHDEEIAFNAGTHTELIRMNFKDFNSLVHPKVIQLN